jgi:hypothetical protein
MQHIVAITEKNTKVKAIKLPQSANKIIIDIIITMAVGICLNDFIIWLRLSPFSKLHGSRRILTIS